MIVKMKKLTLLCLAAMKQNTVDRLADLGAVQVTADKLNDSGDRPALAAELTRLERVIGEIRSFDKPEEKSSFSASPEVLFSELEAKLIKYDALEKELDLLNRQRETFLPWGEFSPEAVAKLKKNSIFVTLCSLSSEEFKKFSAPEGAVVHIVSADKALTRFAVITTTVPPENLPKAQLPENTSLTEVNNRMKEIKLEADELYKQISRAQGALPILLDYQAELQNKYDFLACRDSMAQYGEIAVLTGFVPVPEVDKLTLAAKENGWGIQLEDPAENENPPVLLDMPKWLNPIRPLLEFLGILPGYREVDVSAPMLLFMTIFFSMIVNDAGYCALFLIPSIYCIWRFRDSAKGRQVAALFTLFSFVGLIWGILAGSWFGVAWGGIDFLTNEANKNNNIQFICFTLAVIQLSLGHLIQLFKELKFRNIIVQLGWILVLSGFYIVAVKVVAYPGAMPEAVKYLIGTGVAILLIFNVKWNDVGAIFNFPFEIINCFTDTLSYIRLFAVGMAGGYMASCFNMMGCSIMAGAAWAIPFGVLVIFLAHVLNIALSMISVLVHGVRLNTLEFSSHTSLTWAGSEFKPLKKK